MAGNKEPKTEVVPVRLSQTRKAEWEDALDESQFDSLSGAIRGTMKAHFPHDNLRGREQENTDVNLEPLNQKLDHITEQLDSLRTQISDAQTKKEKLSENDILRLANEIAQIIPNVEDPEDFLPLREASRIDLDSQRASSMATAGAIAEAVEATESDVRRALSILEEDRDDLRTIDEQGFTRYYFDVENIEPPDWWHHDTDE